MYEFKLPDLGEGIHEGEILKWHVEVGATIQEDAPLVDVETDKAAITIPSPCGGTVATINGKVGDTVLVGDVIVVVDDGSGGSISAAAESAAPRETAEPVVVGAASNGQAIADSVATPAPPASWGRVIAVPATRRLARELKIDIHQVPPTGPAGRVTSEDVMRFAEGGAAGPTTAPDAAPEPTPQQERRAEANVAAKAADVIPLLDIEPLPDFTQWGPVETEPLRSIRRKVARKMVTSMILVPHVAHMDDADVTLLEEFRKRERERRAGQPGGKLTLLAFVIKAVAAGLRAAPSFNASLDPFNELIIYKKYYNIGIAVGFRPRPDRAGHPRRRPQKHPPDLNRGSRNSPPRPARARLRWDALRGGTFTITNVGPLGGTGDDPDYQLPRGRHPGHGPRPTKAGRGGQRNRDPDGITANAGVRSSHRRRRRRRPFCQ